MISSFPKVLTVSETEAPGSIKPLPLKWSYFRHEIKFSSDCVSNSARHQVGNRRLRGLLEWTCISAVAKCLRSFCGDSDGRVCAPSRRSTYASSGKVAAGGMCLDETVIDSLKVLGFGELLFGGPLCGARLFLVDCDREVCRHINDQRPNCRYLLTRSIASPLSSCSRTVCRRDPTVVGEVAERAAKSTKGFGLALKERTEELSRPSVVASDSPLFLSNLDSVRPEETLLDLLDFAGRGAAGLRELVMFRMETIEGNWLRSQGRATGQAVTVMFWVTLWKRSVSRVRSIQG